MSVGDAGLMLPTLRAELAVYLQRAYANIGGPLAIEAIDRSLFLLDSMALTTTDYTLLRNHLDNARRYLKQAEWGAARYELRLLLRAVATTT